MKYSIFLIILGLFACKADSSTSKNNSTDKYAEFGDYSGAKLDSIAFKAYSNDQEKAIAAFGKAVAFHEKNNDVRSAAFSNLNLSNLYHEHVEDNVTALVYAQKSLNHWITMGDELQQANLYKYVGLLEGLTGNGQVGKQNIARAIELYSKRNIKDGVAVCHFDLAQVLEKEEDYSEAAKYYEMGRKHWADKKNFGRVLANNIIGIRLYHLLGETEKLNATVEECERIRTNLEVNKYVDQKYIETLLSIGVKEGHDH